MNTQPNKHEIWLAGGCFWGTEQYFQQIQGVLATDVGYANGHTANPTYEEVCTKNTGHAEAVHVEYDADVLSLGFLLRLYFDSVDPLAVNRQGGDTGPQYRTGIYYSDPADLPVIRDELAGLEARLGQKPAIEVAPLDNYTPAETYHQDYLAKNPGGYCHISPAKLQKARAAREYRKKSPQQLAETLTPLQYDVTQNSGTEPPFRNEYHDKFEPGLYVDVTTGEPLFVSSQKFESGCGWPAFAKPIHSESVVEHTDRTHGMIRTEVRSKAGDAHLGHVFEDGPRSMGGLRYCINSAALRFVPRQEMEREGYGEYIGLVDEP